ncbi:MAG: ABC transporter substrate-binding protein [Verrucomicrobiales bacterium]|nr:ABC transporter substrate-binding protein [Verrucomicrobiales bacterium]
MGGSFGRVGAMLWFVRLMLLMIPLGMAAVLAGLWVRLDGLEFRRSEKVVYALGQDLGALDPTVPLRGAERQVEAWLFERLFRFDESLRVVANLATSGKYRQKVTFFFADEKVAQQAELQVLSRILEEKNTRPVRKYGEVKRARLALSVQLNSYDDDNAKRLLEFLPDLELLPVLKVQLQVKGAVRESWADFKKHATEKGQIKREWIEGDRRAVFFIAGDVALFLKELRLYYDSNLNLQPKIEMLGQASYLNEVEWILDLRREVHWHDGQLFTAKDVLFSFENQRRNELRAPWLGGFSHVLSLRAVDDYQLAVQCRDYYAPITESWSRLPILPAHLLEGGTHNQLWADFISHPVGTGALKFGSRDEKGAVSLLPYEDYFRTSDQLRARELVPLADAGERIRGMWTGRLDGVWATGAERVLLDEGDGDFVLQDEVYRQQHVVVWNMDRALFKQVEVRRALAQMVEVGQLLSQGDGLKPDRLWRGIFYPGSWFCEEPAAPLKFELGKAKEDLSAADWHWQERAGAGAEAGEWVNAKQEVLEFTLLYDRASLKHGEMASSLVRQWRAQGIEVEVSALTWDELVELRLKTRDFDAALVSWDLYPGRDQNRVWHSSLVGAEGGNVFALRDAAVDRLLLALTRAADPEEVKDLAGKLQKKILQIQPALFLTESADTLILRKE